MPPVKGTLVVPNVAAVKTFQSCAILYPNAGSVYALRAATYAVTAPYAPAVCTRLVCTYTVHHVVFRILL